MPELILAGCRSQPLGSYLKAFGIFRLVAEQIDTKARAKWSGAAFVLDSRLDRQELLDFFKYHYQPTPIVTPWNGGSGYYANDKSALKAIEAILHNPSPRLQDYQESIVVCRQVLEQLGIDEKPDAQQKFELMRTLRAELPEAALKWFDAAVMLADEDAKYPPLLGTGGNDGRLEFASNHMQYIVEMFAKLAADAAGADAALSAALFDLPMPVMSGGAIGQFDPKAVGGANQGPGFGVDSLVNPWDYVLTLEGALCFSVAATRRLEEAGHAGLSSPFTVYSTGAGYASAGRSDEANSRAEMWLPLWDHFCRLCELKVLLGEGRARLGKRHAIDGTDFARSVASLGIDRGVKQFERYGFQVRNGLSYLATPLGRWTVRRNPVVDLIDADLESWISKFRKAARDKFASESMRRAARAIDEQLLALAADGGCNVVQELLIALAAAEKTTAKADPKTRPNPVPYLDRQWLAAADDQSIEFRLAYALAGTGLRPRMVPVELSKWPRWIKNPGPGLVWAERDLVANLTAVALRCEVEAGMQTDTSSRPAAYTCNLNDLATFLDGLTDDRRIGDLVHALALVRPQSTWAPKSPARSIDLVPTGTFALLALAHHQKLPLDDNSSLPIKATVGMVRRLAAGDAHRAVELAHGRLHAIGCRPLVSAHDVPAVQARRMAAALVVPLSVFSLRRLLDSACVEPASNQELS